MTELVEAGSIGNDADRSYLAEDVRTARDVRIALNLCWMPMTPKKLVAELFSKPAILEACTRTSAKAERDAAAPRPPMRRGPRRMSRCWMRPPSCWGSSMPSGADWPRRNTTAPRPRQRQADAGQHGNRRRGRAGHRGGTRRQNQEREARLTAAERATSDRTWAFGHVVVDEAQELSPMQWRLLMRRCPLKSFTIVGDIAQTSSAAGATAGRAPWSPCSAMLQLEELTVNYRTPTQIAEAAARWPPPRAVDSAPKAVREGQWSPILDRVEPGQLPAALEILPAELEALDGGLLAVIATATSCRRPPRWAVSAAAWAPARRFRAGHRGAWRAGIQGPGVRRGGGRRAGRDAHG